MPPRIVDAHQHFWDADRYHWPLLDRPGSPVARRYEVDDLLADAAAWDLAKSVHFKARSGASTRWTNRLATADRRPARVSARHRRRTRRSQDPNVGSVLEQHAHYQNVRGIRPDPRSGPVRAIGLSDRCPVAGWLPDSLASICSSVPNRPRADARRGTPRRTPSRHPDHPQPYRHAARSKRGRSCALARRLRALAALPHASIKISGFAMFDRPVTAETIEPFVRDAIDIFGTDAPCSPAISPVDRAWTTWDQVFGAFDTLTAELRKTRSARRCSPPTRSESTESSWCIRQGQRSPRRCHPGNTPLSFLASGDRAH